jgi:hypothetical protein
MDHADNEMMRPEEVQLNPNATWTYIMGVDSKNKSFQIMSELVLRTPRQVANLEPVDLLLCQISSYEITAVHRNGAYINTDL